MFSTLRGWARWFVFGYATGVLLAAETPTIPVGLDAYRLWEQWPVQRIGVRAYMRSTYDRKGGNERADAAHFLYQLAEDKNVTLDVAGRGVLYFARYNHWHGSPWTYEVDGVPHVVTETSTADPLKPAENSVFLPQAVFPNPLTWTWSMTKGADLMWVPIAFEDSFRMSYGRTFYGTGYYIYHLIDPAAPTSQPVRAWDGKTPPGQDVLELIARAGSDLVPAVESVAGREMGLSAQSGAMELPADGTPRGVIMLASEEPQMLRALEFSVSRAEAIAFGRVRLRVTWDDAAEASIDAPVALFYGAGTLYNRDEREYLVKAFPVNIRFDAERVHLACFFPMPFARRAKIELVNSSAGAEALNDVRWSVRTAPARRPMAGLGYLHATYRDHPTPVAGEDLVLLDTRQTEGGGDWSGNFVGTSFIFSHRNVLKTLEGDPRFFFDDSLSPQAYGTGTEEWGGGGDYWGGRSMTLPFAGHPCGTPKGEAAKNEEDKIQSAYRFLLADLMPFGKNAVIRLEHGGENDSDEHYETVTYWYGRRGPTLVRMDVLQLGDEASERAHSYVSPTTSAPYVIESRYEWGPDTIKGREIFPAHSEVARKMTGTSEFTLDVDPANVGVLLRRTLDYRFPNQRAEVSVAPAEGGRVGEFRAAGVWYVAGSNTCLFSNASHELAAAEPVVQTSNRRFREDEFLVSRTLTAGHAKVRVRVKFTPVEIPLRPGEPLPERAWTEIRYVAYSLVAPQEDAPKSTAHKIGFEPGLAAWRVEQGPGGSVTVRDGALVIDDAHGCTVWLREKLTAPVEISYEVTVVANGGANDRVSDVNCFWMASEPGTNAMPAPRSGRFGDYDSLQTYYVGMGGNDNTTTRFRRYAGGGPRPLRPEDDLREQKFLLEANRTYRIRVVARDGVAEFWRDGEKIFAFRDPTPLATGWFGFRTIKSHLEIRQLRIAKPSQLDATGVGEEVGQKSSAR